MFIQSSSKDFLINKNNIENSRKIRDKLKNSKFSFNKDILLSLKERKVLI
jgi:hypothetical protein